MITDHVNRIYASIIAGVMESGHKKTTRGHKTLELQDVTLRTSFRFGFPIITARKMYMASSIGEYVSFMHGHTLESQFAKNGCSFWRPNLEAESWQVHLSDYEIDENDWLGEIYGYQWRRWQDKFDQMEMLVNNLKNNPDSRRHIIVNYDPMATVCLPACHMMYQFQTSSNPITSKTQLNMTITQRSLDVLIGLPYDWTLFGLILAALSHECSFEPGNITMNVGSAHIYEEHFKTAQEIVHKRVVSDHIALGIYPLTEFLNPTIGDFFLMNYPEIEYKPKLELMV